MKILTQQQVDQYAEEGATHPIRVFSAGRAAHYLAELEKGEARHGADFRRILRNKSHLALKWVALTDSVEDNGNVKYVPGSHQMGPLTHAEEPGHQSLLSKGQRIVDVVDAGSVKSISLQPG